VAGAWWPNSSARLTDRPSAGPWSVMKSLFTESSVMQRVSQKRFGHE